MSDNYDLVMDGLRGILNDDDCYAADRDAAGRAIDYIKQLLREIDSKDTEILNLKLGSSPTTLRTAIPLDVPQSRGTTHGQLMQMQHEAETMHDNPPHGQPMG